MTHLEWVVLGFLVVVWLKLRLILWGAADWLNLESLFILSVWIVVHVYYHLLSLLLQCWIRMGMICMLLIFVVDVVSWCLVVRVLYPVWRSDRMCRHQILPACRCYLHLILLGNSLGWISSPRFPPFMGRYALRLVFRLPRIFGAFRLPTHISW